jgi:hypothetical protein
MWESIGGLSSLIRLATWGIAVTLVVGGLLTTFTIIADKKRERLVRERDSVKDQYVADTNKLAGDANERAGNANQRAEELAQENVKLRGVFEKSAAETLLREEALKAVNLATESKLEKERKTRLELEKSLAPRSIPLFYNAGKANFDPLKPFAGIQVMYEVLPDSEALRAAGSLRQILEAAGWQTISFVPRADVNIGFFDGVVIESVPGGREAVEAKKTPEQAALWNRMRDAGKALNDFLSSYNWGSRNTFKMPNEAKIPLNTIRIVVGFKPSPYFEPDLVKELKEDSEKMREEMKKRQAEMDARFPRIPSE